MRRSGVQSLLTAGLNGPVLQKVFGKNNGEGYAALSETLPRLRDLSAWKPDAIERIIHDACEKKALQIGAVAQPLRVAVTGTTISPSIHDTLTLLGRDRTVSRIEKCLKLRDTA